MKGIILAVYVIGFLAIMIATRIGDRWSDPEDTLIFAFLWPLALLIGIVMAPIWFLNWLWERDWWFDK